MMGMKPEHEPQRDRYAQYLRTRILASQYKLDQLNHERGVLAIERAHAQAVLRAFEEALAEYERGKRA